MSGSSLLGVFLAVIHLAWHPQWIPWHPHWYDFFPLSSAVLLLVAAPIMVPFLGVQEMKAHKAIGKAAAEDALDEPQAGAHDHHRLRKARANEFVSEPSNPFKNDLLRRQTEVESLCSILLGVRAPAVFSVDADWGQGKTAFLKMSSALMRSDSFAQEQSGSPSSTLGLRTIAMTR